MRNFLVTAIVAVCASQAGAATTTYNFTANYHNGGNTNTAVTIVDTAAAFSTLTGQLTFDDTFVSWITTGIEAIYAAPSLSIDQFSLSSTNTFTGTGVRNSSFDRIYSIDSALPSDGQYHDRVSFILDGNSTALSSTALPDPINLADFNRFAPVLFFTSSISTSARERIDFRFTSLTKSVPNVPLPAGLPLLAAGIVALGIVRRRKTR